MAKILNGADLQKTELQNAVIQNLSDFPASPKQGQIFYLALNKTMYQFDGANWLPTTFAYKGVFNAATQYHNLDVVTYNGSLYTLLPSATLVAPGILPTSASWDMLAQAGLSSTYTNASAMPQGVGGISAGHTFNNESINQVFNELFYPYQSPAFSSFGITGQSAQVEVGTSLSGSKTFTWTVSNSSNVQANSVQILQGATVLASGLAASGTTTVPITTVANNTPASQVWTIRGTNTNGITFSSTFTVSWYFYKFNGKSASTTLDSTAIKSLSTSSLATAGTGTYAFVAGDMYAYIAFPATFSAANSFKDTSTLLTVTMADSSDDASYSNTANGNSFALVNVTNTLGVTQQYRVYRSKYKLGGAISIVVA